jgi:SAM-dependent methyltransferase
VKKQLQQLVTGWVDLFHRHLNGKGYLPPWDLRATVGFPADFEVTGAEFLAYLKLLCGLKSNHQVLDVGCGCGMMALQLRNYLSMDGGYVGMDIDRRAIRWCETHIGAEDTRFQFVYVDLYNRRYNPTGGERATDFCFSHPDGSFDVILLKSVFTHMRPEEVQNYLQEIRRLLKPLGRCLASFFLLDQEGTGERSLRPPAKTFDYGDAMFRYADPDLPEKAVAYPETRLLSMLDRAGLALVEHPYRGDWSGRPNCLSFQDLLLIGIK